MTADTKTQTTKPGDLLIKSWEKLVDEGKIKFPKGERIIAMDFAKKPSLWKLLTAKLFGQKMIGRDGTTMVVMRFHNGCYYVEDVRHG